MYDGAGVNGRKNFKKNAYKKNLQKPKNLGRNTKKTFKNIFFCGGGGGWKRV